MAIEKLPSAPVNLSGGSLLSRQASNIPEGGNLLGNAVENLVRSYEPTLKAAAIKEAEAAAAVVGIVRGPNGEYIRPPEPDGGLIYNEVYNKAIDQSYAASMSYDFQMKADQIVADNYTDPDKAITLMDATLSGMVKGMDPRFVATVTPVLQSELQQRAYGVRNRAAGDAREAIIRTTNEQLSTAIAEISLAWETGDTPKADALRQKALELGRTAISLNYYNEGILDSINAKMDIAQSRGIKAAEIEERTRRYEELRLQKAEQELTELETSSSTSSIIYTALANLGPDGVATLNDIANNDVKARIELPELQIPMADGTTQPAVLDAASFRLLLPDVRQRREIVAAITGMHNKYEAIRKYTEKQEEDLAFARGVLSDAQSGIIPDYTPKEIEITERFASGLYEKYTGSEVLDYKNPKHQQIALATAKNLVRLDSTTVRWMTTAIRTNDPEMLDAAARLYGNAKIATNGKTEIGSVLLKDLAPKDIELFEMYAYMKKNPAYSKDDMVLHLQKARNDEIVSYNQMASYFEQPYDAIIYQNLARQLGLPSGSRQTLIPPEMFKMADKYARINALAGGSPKEAMMAGVRAAAERYTVDERSTTGIGPRNFDTIVPPNVVDLIAKKYPEFLGKELGPDVKYTIKAESGADQPIVQFVLMEGKNVRSVVELDPVTDLPRETRPASTQSGLTQEQIDLANDRRELNNNPNRMLRPGIPFPKIPPPPLDYDEKTGNVSVLD